MVSICCGYKLLPIGFHLGQEHPQTHLSSYAECARIEQMFLEMCHEKD